MRPQKPIAWRRRMASKALVASFKKHWERAYSSQTDGVTTLFSTAPLSRFPLATAVVAKDGLDSFVVTVLTKVMLWGIWPFTRLLVRIDKRPLLNFLKPVTAFFIQLGFKVGIFTLQRAELRLKRGGFLDR